MTASVTLYRQLITDPRHGDPASAPPTILPGLTDAQIEALLDRAVAAHNVAFWGSAVYPEAMVLYAAHCAESSPGLLAASSTSVGTGTVGPLVNRKDDLLQRGYGLPAGYQFTGQADAWLLTTVYGMRYLGLRGSRACAAPFVVSA